MNLGWREEREREKGERECVNQQLEKRTQLRKWTKCNILDSSTIARTLRLQTSSLLTISSLSLPFLPTDTMAQQQPQHPLWSGFVTKRGNSIKVSCFFQEQHPTASLRLFLSPSLSLSYSTPLHSTPFDSPFTCATTISLSFLIPTLVFCSELERTMDDTLSRWYSAIL